MVAQGPSKTPMTIPKVQQDGMYTVLHNYDGAGLAMFDKKRTFELQVVDYAPNQVEDSGPVCIQDCNLNDGLPQWVTQKPPEWARYRWINVDSIDELTVATFGTAFNLDVRIDYL